MIWPTFWTFHWTLSHSVAYRIPALTGPIAQVKYRKTTRLLDIPGSTATTMKLAITWIVGWPLLPSLRTQPPRETLDHTKDRILLQPRTPGTAEWAISARWDYTCSAKSAKESDCGAKRSLSVPTSPCLRYLSHCHLGPQPTNQLGPFAECILTGSI